MMEIIAILDVPDKEIRGTVVGDVEPPVAAEPGG